MDKYGGHRMELLSSDGYIRRLQKRAKISSTLIDKMRLMGIFEGMDESSQLSLF